ncbi:hypothetical protein AVEN_115654-1 [Araneus ventricosus]|uniref:Uncharacterized protein n=1 Tax=Araneus ventricosus TaxID=182803 RepID=A0A4Y2QPP6_ARAVE|nr:hypothetical protein AVEN_193655-1 [Araneus ventricosus]GBN65788.1 hypothetical protein AVEN_263597-1 [Araneus ventricosus]GBN65816.1 hypothetical protein AVEN_111291-1 [Araneus ventricosus]GBN65817.1 hypothetical protein AVEN_115654-1 [Araneus ventricosus]
MGESVEMGYGRHGGGFGRCACGGPACTADLRWNRVSSLEPSGREAGILPLAHRGPPNWYENRIYRSVDDNSWKTRYLVHSAVLSNGLINGPD